jgi:glycosyltransferase involved in cell wall biosynthesis
MGDRDLRVLLMSPLPDVDPFCGDVIYTQALLEQPPAGVEYVRYDDAVRSGELHELGRRPGLEAGESLTERTMAYARLLREHGINAARDRGLLFREPFRYLEVRGTFDLIHCHTYSVCWSGRPTPVLVSNALPLTELYLKARGWSDRRVRITGTVDRGLARALGVDHIEYGLSEVDRLVTFTHALRDWYVDRGVPADRIGVAPCFPSAMPSEGTSEPVTGRIGFVAGDFRAKGGDLVVAAMELVRRERPDAHLWIAGGSPPLDRHTVEAAAITLCGYLSRDELLTKFLPSCEVFAYPSRFDGLPLTLLEALGSGVPVVVSDYFALPEVVSDGQSGRIVAGENVKALAAAILDLLEPSGRKAAVEGALHRYRSMYSAEGVLPVLRQNYDLTIAQGRQMTTTER